MSETCATISIEQSTTVDTQEEVKENEVNDVKQLADEECKVEMPTEGQKASFTIFGYRFWQIKWSNVIWLIVLHTLSVYAYIHVSINPVKLFTVLFTALIAMFSGFGMSVGAHRLWAHRSFKARLPLRIFLLILQTMTVNGSAYSYARDHRTHHKWSETEADPKNPSRGFFFAHIGWWMLKKRPQVIENGKKIPLEDLHSDTFVMLQHKLYIPLVVLLGFAFPTLVPHFCWNENLLTAFLLCAILRTVVVLHHLFTVNSVAHFWGDRPYDRHMRPSENRLVIYLSMGEGNHNYHHTFPWDYSSSEKKGWEFFNPATLFIDFNAAIGLAYDRKKPSKEMVRQVVQRKGLPEYFANKDDKSVLLRALYGLIDWVFGITFALWPLWPIIIFKAITNRQIFVF